jgi:hypothetical protein
MKMATDYFKICLNLLRGTPQEEKWFLAKMCSQHFPNKNLFFHFMMQNNSAISFNAKKCP